MTEVSAGVPSPGEVFAGKYRVESVLGTGGMGVVVAALHEQLGQRVAIKFVREHAQQETVARFCSRRARAAEESEHVARRSRRGDAGVRRALHGHGAARGLDLGELLDQRGPLPLSDAVEHIVQACEAIAEAHAAGIVHRDIKPHNLFLTTRPTGRRCIKVLDFGVSKALSLAKQRRRRP